MSKQVTCTSTFCWNSDLRLNRNSWLSTCDDWVWERGRTYPRIFSKHPSSREEWVSEHIFCRDIDLATEGDVPYGIVVLYPDTPLINNLCFDPLFKNVIKLNTEVDYINKGAGYPDTPIRAYCQGGIRFVIGRKILHYFRWECTARVKI